MAIGLGGMFGFTLPENFEYPYNSPSLIVFWQRWNITVLGWFRKYLYPWLKSFSRSGGNLDKAILNLLFTWIIFALWHGSGWTIFLWGIVQFAFLTLEHFRGYVSPGSGRWYTRIYTMAVVMLSFVFLRTENLYQAGSFFKNLFALNYNGISSAVAWVLIRENWLWLGAALICSFPAGSLIKGKGAAVLSALYPLMIAGLLALTAIFYLQEWPIPFEYY
jgi:D-alanyl-lipoteichoic acid acyltransferase DltB (MBOAT superfamily)